MNGRLCQGALRGNGEFSLSGLLPGAGGFLSGGGDLSGQLLGALFGRGRGRTVSLLLSVDGISLGHGQGLTLGLDVGWPG